MQNLVGTLPSGHLGAAADRRNGSCSRFRCGTKIASHIYGKIASMYQFKLESLLNHRRYQEDVLQKELANLKKRLQAEQQQLRNLRKKKRRILQ